MKNKTLINIGIGFVTIAAAVETGILIYRTGFVRPRDNGHQQGSYDTQMFLNDVDRNSYINFFMEKTGENRYTERATHERKTPPLEEYVNKNMEK